MYSSNLNEPRFVQARRTLWRGTCGLLAQGRAVAHVTGQSICLDLGDDIGGLPQHKLCARTALNRAPSYRKIISPENSAVPYRYSLQRVT